MIIYSFLILLYHIYKLVTRVTKKLILYNCTVFIVSGFLSMSFCIIVKKILYKNIIIIITILGPEPKHRKRTHFPLKIQRKCSVRYQNVNTLNMCYYTLYKTQLNEDGFEICLIDNTIKHLIFHNKLLFLCSCFNLFLQTRHMDMK